MVAENYNDDLNNMFKRINDIITDIEEACAKIYKEEGLIFDEKKYPFRSVEGDIYTKVLGQHLQKVLGKECTYEEKLTGRLRADIQICNPKKIVIEVKSHGQFDSDALEERFKRLTTEKGCSENVYLYVAFKERKDYVEKTNSTLLPLGVSTFYFSTYVDNKSGYKLTPHPEELEKLTNAIRALL